MLKLVRLILVLTTILIIFEANAGNDPSSQVYPINGQVFTEKRQPLSGASILVSGSHEGCISDSSGLFNIQVLSGSYRLQASFIGYRQFDTLIFIDGPLSINISLKPDEQILEVITIIADQQPAEPAGFLKMDRETMNKIPVLMGERDVLKTCQYFPGIHSVVDGNTGISVRGGNIDENLILLDQATLYNPSHLMGFFSVFNTDAIKDVEVYKGNSPSGLGGRLSSVFDVRMADGMTQKVQGTGEIGLISSKMTLKGPLIKDKLSFNISGRRSYADLFMPVLNSPAYKDTRIYFYDIYGKLTSRISPKHKISLSGYLGKDVFRNKYAYSGYGNRMASLQWEFEGKNRINGGTNFNYSEYAYQVGTYQGDKPNSFTWESKIKEIGFRQFFSVPMSGKQALDVGCQLNYHLFDPCRISGKGENSLLNETKLDLGEAVEGVIYAEHSFQISSRLRVRYGFRLSGFADLADLLHQNAQSSQDLSDSLNTQDWDENISCGPEPRLRISYRLYHSWWMVFSYSRNQQYIHLAHTSLAGNPLDVWFPSNGKIPPERSDQVVMGVNGPFNNGKLKLNVDVFYKKITNSIEFTDHSRLISEVDFADNISQGKGWAGGVEIMLSKEKGKFNGWISYAFTRSFKQFDDINARVSFPSSYDIPHDLSVVMNYTVSDRINLSGVWVYSSGKPYTSPATIAVINNTIVPVYSGRNSSRSPGYHRLDLSLTISSKPCRKIYSEWIIAVYNAYNHKNQMNMQFIPEGYDTFKLKMNRNYLFPILPSVSYRIQF